MPVAETLVFSLGPVVAKAILKHWLKEGVALDMSASLADTLKASISDVFARERTADQIKAIGRQVAESLKLFFESEGFHFDDETQERLARAMADTLDQANINAKVLLNQNLSAAELYEHLQKQSLGATDGFAEAESAFYQRLLKETCKYIVDIAGSLPAFQSQAFQVVITKENEILAVAQGIRAELDRVRTEALKNNPQAKAREFEADYLNEVGATQDEVKLFGTELSDSHRRYCLSVAYVTLSAQARTPRVGNTKERAATDNEIGSGPVDEMLKQSQRLLVRGMAGSGKTTLLQWLAVHSARHHFPGELAEWNNTVPFFIRLREFAHKDLPSPHDFPSLISSYVKQPPAGWVIEQMESGRALILIDGIDEVPKARREAVRDWIGELCRKSKGRILVTSRPHALEEDHSAVSSLESGWLDAYGFTEAELQPMSLPDILAFIDHWRKAVCGDLVDIREQDRLQGHAERLKLTVEERLAVRDLATSPLLCAMLCSLHRDRDDQIPTRRTELYEACIKMLLARDRARLLPEDDYPKLEDTYKRSLLEAVAWWMLQNGYTSASKDDMLNILEQRLPTLHIPFPAPTERVLRLLVERTVMREPAKEQFDFAHRTFQEYLAAHQAVNTNQLGVLLRNAHDDSWRETVILAVGVGRREIIPRSAFAKTASKLWKEAPIPDRITEGEALIDALLWEGDQKVTRRPALYLLAAACMETIFEHTSLTRREVEARLSQLDPPDNNAQALAFGAAGAMALPFLSLKEGQTEQCAAACVRALAHIGTPEALNKIVEYATLNNEIVREEICRAWDRFDKYIYRQQVLSIVYPQTEIKVDDARTLRRLRYYVNLTNLDLSWTQVTDLSPLSSLTALTNLYLTRTQVIDLSPLSSLTALTNLNLSWTQVTDLSTLSSLTTLTNLNLTDTQITDLSPLSSLTALTNLNLSWTQVTELSPLSSLTALTNLNLSWTQVTDLSTLSSLTALTNLDLTRTQITDLSPLSSLTALTNLNLSWTQVTDLSTLSSLTTLTNLNLTRTQVTDLSPVSSLTALTNLNLTDTQITDLSLLSSLTALTNLNLTDTQITDLSPLSSLTALTNLNLTRTQITDLSPLSSLTALTNLNLTRTQVTDLSPLSSLTAITNLDLYGTQVTDLSPLSSLTAITNLDLAGMQVTDLSPLSSLTAITNLYLAGTQVIDLSPLSSLTALIHLNLYETQVIDLSPLSSLTALIHLNLYETQVIDLSPLSSLTALTNLNLSGTQVIDLSPLSSLTGITYRFEG